MACLDGCGDAGERVAGRLEARVLAHRLALGLVRRVSIWRGVRVGHKEEAVPVRECVQLEV
jgi:hypothetical protein